MGLQESADMPMKEVTEVRRDSLSAAPEHGQSGLGAKEIES